MCDDVDDCPDVFDPGQVDLDGDGVGWVCDPYESVPIQNLGSIAGQKLTAAIHGLTAGFTVPLGCTSFTNCIDEVVVATPYGKAIVRSDSTAAEDQWLANNVVRGPLITSDDHLVWWRIGTPDDTGNYDVLTHQYTPLANHYPSDQAIVDQAVELLEVGNPNGGAFPVLESPQAGQFVQLVGPNTLVQNPSSSSPTAFGYVGDPAIIGVPYKTSAMSFLATYSPGASALTPVQVNGNAIAGVDEIVPLTGGNGPSVYGFTEIPYCVRSGTSTMYVGIRADGITSGPLPFASCANVYVFVDTQTNQTAILVGDMPDTTWSVFYIRNGQITHALDGVPYGLFTLHPGKLPVFTVVPNGTQTMLAWVLGANGLTQLSSNLQHASVSTFGDTAHVLGVGPPAQGQIYGPLVLVRYREATGVQQVTLFASSSASTTAVTTSAEGAAIASGYGVTALPSASLTPVALNLTSAAGEARGATTVLVGTKPAVNQVPALYAYDEVGGAPRITELTPESSSTGIYSIDPPRGPASTWFEYENGATVAFAQIGVVGGIPTLVNQIALPTVSNSFPIPSLQGLTAGGDLVATITDNANFYVYVLGASAGALVAHTSNASRSGTVIDYGRWPFPVVGWFGPDATSSVACLAMQPDHCWTLPSGAGLQTIAASSKSPDANGSFALFVLAPQTIGILHTLGNGDRGPPLP